MELKITDFFNRSNPIYYSASCAEIGQDAGKITWENALNCEFRLLNSEEEKEAARDHLRAYGAWTDEEIAAWGDDELNAITVQDISAAIREFQEVANSDWKEWQKLSESGAVSGLLYGGELSVDGEVYFYLRG